MTDNQPNPSQEPQQPNRPVWDAAANQWRMPGNGPQPLWDANQGRWVWPTEGAAPTPPPPSTPPPSMPQYPSPAPPPKRRHRGLLITAVVLGIALIACVAIVVSAVGGDDTTGTAADEPNEAEAAPTFGQPVRDGMFEFTITDVTCGQQSIGEDPFTETAQGEFCLVDMNVRNVGTEARTFDASYQKAMTAAGETYQADDSLAIAANEGESAVFNNINPGNQVDGTVAFDVPKGTKLTTIELHDDILSGGVQAPLE